MATARMKSEWSIAAPAICILANTWGAKLNLKMFPFQSEDNGPKMATDADWRALKDSIINN